MKLKNQAEAYLKDKRPNKALNLDLMDEIKRYEEYQFKIAQALIAPTDQDKRYALKREFIPLYLIERAKSPIVKELPIETILD
jgi:hypothetical protein